MSVYTTMAGDMWDQIAHTVYGSTSYTSKLIAANPQYSDVYFFPAGIELEVPKLDESDVDSSFVPPWKR